MTAAECARAVDGDLRLSNATTARAVSKMWNMFRAHAADVHGVGRRAAAEINMSDDAEDVRHGPETSTRENHANACAVALDAQEVRVLRGA